MAEIDRKYVQVEPLVVKGNTTAWGYGTSWGDIANNVPVQTNPTDNNIDPLYSGADIRSLYYATTAGDIILELTGNRANSGWDTMVVASTTYQRSSATYAYFSGSNFTQWRWSSSNTFGTTSGANILVTWNSTPSDSEIDSLSFTDVANAVGGTAYYASDQLTGIDVTINVTTPFGTGTRGFYISSSATPSTTASLYTTAAKTATNNQYVHCRVVASSTPSASTDITITAGSPSKSDTFNVTTAQDTSPNNYTFDPADDVGLSTLVVSNTETITGITGSVSVSVSGQGTPRISINGGSYVSSGTISNNQTLKVRLTSSASNSTAHTATVTLGTGTFAQETFVVTTLAASGGGGGPISGGSSTYGVEITDTNGTTKVLSPSTRYAVRVTDVVTFSFTANGTANDDVLLTTNMTDLTTANSDVLFLPGSSILDVTRESNGFRVTNLGTGSFTQTMFAIRF